MPVASPQGRVAIYAGTFDPITNGHVDILRRALKLYDRVIVAVAENTRKQPLFPMSERAEMIRASFVDDSRVEVDSFTGLLVDYAREGRWRDPAWPARDRRLEYEFQLAHMNRHLAPDVETVFLMTSEDSFYVSSSLVKEVAAMGGDITRIVPPAVLAALHAKFPRPRSNS